MQLHPDLPRWMAESTQPASNPDDPTTAVVPARSAIVLVQRC